VQKVIRAGASNLGAPFKLRGFCYDRLTFVEDWREHVPYYNKHGWRV